MNKKAKLEGLKSYSILQENEGVIFVYKTDTASSFDFSEIRFNCRIYFLDSQFDLIHKESTKPYQTKLITCHKPFRYVIEIGA